MNLPTNKKLLQEAAGQICSWERDQHAKCDIATIEKKRDVRFDVLKVGDAPAPEWNKADATCEAATFVLA